VNAIHLLLRQRPLDGFTIKRGIGKGAIGGVYLALSDGGKEVAETRQGQHPSRVAAVWPTV
jgi:hypothetical protein